jgi:LysR family transcriptional regulator, nitrogen assimilation regulatory protein
MDLQRLKTFLKVAELGSLSKASDRMRIAQPALSRQIRLLEDEIGVPLFARHRRGMELTLAGETLMNRISGLLRQLDQSIADVRSLAGEATGPVAFGIVPTASYILAGRLATRVTKDAPDISLRIVEGYTGHLIDWLHRGEIDVAILYGPEADFHMHVEELMLEDLVLVGPADSALSPKQPVTVAEFARLPLVLPSHPHGLRLVVENAAARARAKLKVCFEADSFRVLKDLVENGLGYTALPFSSIFREEREGRLRFAPLVKPKVTRQLILAMPPDSTPSRATKVLVQLVREEIASLVRAGDWQAYLQFSLEEAIG